MKKTHLSPRAALEMLGFSHNATKVYTALLELGKGTVTEIARGAHINRTTAYDVLETLAGRGLVSVLGRKPKQEYAAEPPEKIVDALREELGETQEKLKHAEELLPELTSLYKTGDRPKVKFYEGVKGLIQAYEDTLNSKESIRAFANPDAIYKTLPKYFPKYIAKRVAKNISIRAIAPKTAVGAESTKRNKEELRETALVPQEQFSFSPEINIYENKVMIASWKEELGIIIESEEIADAMKKIFELAWAEAKRLEKQ